MSIQQLAWVFATFLGLGACGTMQTGLPKLSDVLNSAAETQTAQSIDADMLRASLTPQVLAQAETRLLILEVPTRDAVAVLSLINTNQGVDTYLTADGVSISLRDGIVVATRGFGFDLMTAEISETLAALKQGSTSAVRIHRYLDGENHTDLRSFVCDVTVQRNLSAVEICHSATFSFENSYNFNDNGFIVESRQWVSSEIGYVRVNILN